MSVVLDASAILAVVFEEVGAERVLNVIGDSTASTVTLCEAATKMIDRGWEFDSAQKLLRDFGMKLMPFDEHLALDAARMRRKTARKGLSLGDRACLALAEREGLPVLTSDRTWADLSFAIRVELIR